MPIFVTEQPRYVGPNIEANTWEEAQEQCNKLDIDLIGVLVEDDDE